MKAWYIEENKIGSFGYSHMWEGEMESLEE
jgi:hypothetical protein